MDVKFGSGAFMRELDDARRLALELKRVGTGLGLKLRCALTDMGSPLGDAAGNALEVEESLAVLKGEGPADTRALTLALAVEMVRLAAPQRAADEVQASLTRHLADGSAYALFLKLAAAQGADVASLERPKGLRRAKFQLPVLPDGPRRDGTITSCDVRALGLAVLELGGGRRLVTDRVDPWVGLTGMKRVGAAVAPDEPIAVVHANDEARGRAAVRLVAKAYRVSEGGAPPPPPLVAEWL
jgi:thymidine phosphorylase